MHLIAEPSLGLLARAADYQARLDLTIAIQTAPTDLWWGHHLSHVDTRLMHYPVN